MYITLNKLIARIATHLEEQNLLPARVNRM